jgi:V8-like Glu-specific endopeptidase
LSPFKHLLLGSGLLCFLTTQSWAQGADPIIRNNRPVSATLGHWTAEAMANAKPKLIPTMAGAGHHPNASSVMPAMQGTPGVAGGMHDTQLPQSAIAEIENGSPIPADGTYPGPHTTFTLDPAYGRAVTPYTAYPYSAIGRLFFTDPGVGDFVCTAAATYGGAALNIVWTAGHCIADGGKAKFYTNWLYCPAWNKNKGGVNPTFGCWSWASASTKGAWFNNGAFTRDVGYVALQPTGTVLAENVVSATGGLGFAWNWGRDQNWIHMGYPAEGSYDGGYIVQTNTEHRYDDAPDALGPPTNSFGSSQTPGSSGSPVILFWSPGGGYINSNISYYYAGQLGFELQGPYYDTGICNFWKTATGWSGAC